MLQWKGDRAGKVTRANVAVFKVASGRYSASSLAGMKLERQVKKKSAALFTTLPCPTGGGGGVIFCMVKIRPKLIQQNQPGQK